MGSICEDRNLVIAQNNIILNAIESGWNVNRINDFQIEFTKELRKQSNITYDDICKQFFALSDNYKL